MRKKFVCLLGIGLMLAARGRADTTVSDGSPDTFSTAVDDTVAAGGGTILVTTPILITGGVDETFEAVSNVVVSGGNTNSLFIVQGASLTLSNFTLINGRATNGGAISVAADGSLTVTSCTFSNNIAQGADGLSSGTNSAVGGGQVTAGEAAFGGAIFNLGAASIFNCQFLTNRAVGGNGGDSGTGRNEGAGGNGGSATGGGIYNLGMLLLVNSSFAGNLAAGGNGGAGNPSGTIGSGGIAGSGAGAGLFSADPNEPAVILNCTFSDNIAQGGVSGDGGVSSAGMGRAGRTGSGAFGGGVDNAGLMAATNCTFFKNIASGGSGGNGGNGGGRGGAGGNGGRATGGGLYNAGSVSVVNCTFAQGAAIGGTNGTGGSGIVSGSDGRRGGRYGGNIANVAKKRKGSLFLMNSIVAASLAGGGGYGRVADGGFNISADKSIAFKRGSGSKSKVNPRIGDLGDNGGPTETIPLMTNSPAVDVLDPSIAPDTDQRGVTRPQTVFASLSDIGAYELDVNSAKILSQPQSASVIKGSNVTFSVTAAGAAPLYYQWFFNGAPLDTFTNSSLTITNVQSTNAGNFLVVVSNSFNSVTSRVAVLTVTNIVTSAPTIITEPASQNVVVGGTATFSITAAGTAPLFYQWVFQVSSVVFTNITGATNSTFSITNAQTAQQGNYAVTVTNSFGSTNSTTAALYVTNSSGGGITPP
jgi:hypothetical protein